FTNFFQVPLQDLFNGYLFQANPAGGTTGEPGYDTGIINPSGAVNPETDASEPGGNGLGLLWGSTGNPFEGGTGAGDTMPWDGLNYQLNLLQPFQTFFDSLEQTPSTSGIDGTGIDSFSLTDVTHTLENLEAGFIIDFDPFTAGSPACPGLCDIPANDQIPGLVAAIANADPSNTTLANWVSDYALDPTNVNEPTQDQINASIALLQTGSYNFSPTELAQVDQALANINPELPALYTNAGIITDPDYLAYTTDPSSVTDPTTGDIESVYGGYNYWLDGSDFIKLLQDAGTTPVDPTLSADLQTLATDFSFPGDPAALQAVLGGAPVAASASAVDVSSLDPSLSSDLSTLLASLGTTVGSDAVSAALADISAQITADLATFVPQSLLSLF
ncbi:MAG: hypothetical protein WB777_25400, partial [Mycobacterium sp.]